MPCVQRLFGHEPQGPVKIQLPGSRSGARGENRSLILKKPLARLWPFARCGYGMVPYTPETLARILTCRDCRLTCKCSYGSEVTIYHAVHARRPKWPKWSLACRQRIFSHAKVARIVSPLGREPFGKGHLGRQDNVHSLVDLPKIRGLSCRSARKRSDCAASKAAWMVWGRENAARSAPSTVRLKAWRMLRTTCSEQPIWRVMADDRF